MSLAALVSARIAASVPGIKSIGTAADLAALKASSMVFPAAYVLPGQVTGGDSRLMTGSVSQRRQMRVQVLLAVRNLKGVRGEAGMSDIATIEASVDAALFGWHPDAQYEPLVLVSGGIVEMLDGVVWWQSEYATACDRRN